MREHDTICELVSYPARWCHTIENEPPCGGACKKAQRFNRCEGCPTAEEVTGRVKGVNPIGRSQPDREQSTRSEGVDSSRSGAHLTPHEYSRIRRPTSGLRRRDTSAGPGHRPAPPVAAASGRAVTPVGDAAVPMGICEVVATHGNQAPPVGGRRKVRRARARFETWRRANRGRQGSRAT